MKCPYCNHLETEVTDKRETEENKVTRRRRECLKCHKRFTTYENIDLISLKVIKKDGRREPFDRNKLRKGLERSLEKRLIPQTKVEEIINEIEQKLKTRKSIEISSTLIGELIMNKLKKLDKVAYIRFASVYRDFKDVKDFEKEIKEIK